MDPSPTKMATRKRCSWPSPGPEHGARPPHDPVSPKLAKSPFMFESFLWWQRGIIYQICPRSFMDINGNKHCLGIMGFVLEQARGDLGQLALAPPEAEGMRICSSLRVASGGAFSTPSAGPAHTPWAVKHFCTTLSVSRLMSCCCSGRCSPRFQALPDATGKGHRQSIPTRLMCSHRAGCGSLAT
jgi:hypothetical protein